MVIVGMEEGILKPVLSFRHNLLLSYDEMFCPEKHEQERKRVPTQNQIIHSSSLIFCIGRIGQVSCNRGLHASATI